MNTNTVEIRPDNPDTDAAIVAPLRGVDEILIGDWFHLERMDGVNKREWSLIITNGDGRPLNICLTEHDGLVIKATIMENSWDKKI